MARYDLFPLRDEKTVLLNPHKGWYWHYIDCGYSRPRYRDDDSLIGDPSSFPCRQLYLRFDWCDINPEENVWDFSYLDSIMDQWGKQGYTFSMRMCCFQTEVMRWGNNQRATPAYVRQRARGFQLENNAWEPDYADPYFLQMVEKTLNKLGEHYNHDPRLAFVDVGSFGRYGEGHTTNGLYGLDILRQHIAITRKAFPDKLVLVNDDLLRHNPDATDDLIAYCLENGVGIRDDSICVESHARRSPGYDTIHSPRLFDPFYPNFPVDIEFAHGELIPEDVWQDGYPAIAALQRTHATYAGFHDYPGRFLERNQGFVNYCANRLGYWFRPDSLELNADGSGCVTVENMGWANAYHPYRMLLRLRNSNGVHYDLGVIADARDWNCGEIITSSFRICLEGIPKGTYFVEFALLDEDLNCYIKLALQETCHRNNWYEAGEISI